MFKDDVSAKLLEISYYVIAAVDVPSFGPLIGQFTEGAAGILCRKRKGRRSRCTEEGKLGRHTRPRKTAAVNGGLLEARFILLCSWMYIIEY